MSEEPVNRSFGILKSLKKLIFEDSTEDASSVQSAQAINQSAETKTTENVTKNPQTNLTRNTSDLPVTDVKQMKIKVLEILEKINEPGIDFFEVWNAAAEMGIVDVNSIKAAYTSLRYVDKTLTKDKLLLTGKKYATGLKEIIDKETEDKQLQKQNIEQNLVKEKASLSDEISEIENNINQLRERLSLKQKDLKEINSKYAPELESISHKIAIGNTAVTEVITDIKNALTMIENNINS